MKISLAPYGPLIQLLAGIYLLFLYERFFRKNPLTLQQTGIKEALNNFINQYQGNLSPDQVKNAQNFIYSREIKWKNFSTTIKRIYLLSFLFCVFLLIYVGTENIEEISKYHYALQAMDGGVLLYSITLWLLYQKKHLLKKFISVIIVFFILVILFHQFNNLNTFFISHNIILLNQLSTNQITILSLILCFTGIIVSCTHITLTFIHTYIIKRRIRRLSTNVGLLVDILMKRKKTNQLPKKLQNRISNWLIDNNLNSSGFRDFLQQEVNIEFNSFMNSTFTFEKLKKIFAH